MRKSTIQRANFRVIEAELYNYHETVKQLKDMREEIMDSSGCSGSSGSGPGCPTESKAMRLSSPRIVEIERRVNAISETLELLKINDEGRYKLLNMKYFERRYTDKGIMAELYIGQNTFYRWRRDIIETIAEKIGYQV